MKYIYLANGEVANQLLRWLIDRGDRPSGLVVHPADRSLPAEGAVTLGDLR